MGTSPQRRVKNFNSVQEQQPHVFTCFSDTQFLGKQKNSCSSHSIQEAEQSSVIRNEFLLLNCFSTAIFNSLLVPFFYSLNDHFLKTNQS